MTITFSGDVARPNDPIMKPPVALGATDYLVIERARIRRVIAAPGRALPREVPAVRERGELGDRKCWPARRAWGPVMRGVATHLMVRQCLLHAHANGGET